MIVGVGAHVGSKLIQSSKSSTDKQVVQLAYKLHLDLLLIIFLLLLLCCAQYLHFGNTFSYNDLEEKSQPR
jgi:hypothetical protein